MPVIALVPDNEHLDKITSNIEEVAARKGKVITIGPLKKTTLNKDGGHIKIPNTRLIEPNNMCRAATTHFLLYCLWGTDVDKPRNSQKVLLLNKLNE